jgi:hypothetical protein
MSPPSLGRAAINVIYRAIDQVFDRIKARFLGPHAGPRQIGFIGKINPILNLPGLFKISAIQEGATPDEQRISSLVGIAETYLDSQKERAKAQLVQAVDSFLQESHNAGRDIDFETVLNAKLVDTWKELSTNVKRIITSEASKAQTMGTLEAIAKINASTGIDDPVVYFICVKRDGYPCVECRRLHLLEDNDTPRLWYMSECTHDYGKRGNLFPSLSGQHPNCQCVLATIFPGWGFKNGSLTYIGANHNAILEQRGTAQEKTG